MANKRKMWTLQEEEVLKKCVKESKTLTEAFKKTADKTGRPAKGVEQHYYYAKKHVLLIYKEKQPQKTFLTSIVSLFRNLFN